MNRIIIDTDAGVDDAQAILMAFGHKGTIVEAITTVSGNVDVEKTTANVLKVLDIAKQDVPVYPHALIDMANTHPGELSIVAIGPLTNIAIATMLDPDLPGKFKELTIMGGAVTGKGNTNINAEFNIFFDPDAAHIVFDRWPMVRVLDWETTIATGLSKGDIDTLFSITTPKAEFFQKTNANTMAFIKEHFKIDLMFAPDGLAMAAALAPSIIKKKEVRHLSVELSGEQTRGLTVVDWFGMGGKTPNAEIIMEVDQPRFAEMMANGLK